MTSGTFNPNVENLIYVGLSSMIQSWKKEKEEEEEEEEEEVEEEKGL